MSQPSEKRIERAWSDHADSRVVSESIYTFDLDERTLSIEDRDFIFVGNSGPAPVLPAGTHAIKQIRRTATSVHHILAKLPTAYSVRNSLGGEPVEGVAVAHSLGEETTTVSLKIASAQRFDNGERYRLDLTYSVPLETSGPVLVFTGAIQPTDYDFVRKLGVAVASKSVTLVVRRSTAFTAYFFEPEQMNYFPAPHYAEPVISQHCYQAHHDMSTLMRTLGRARYFTVVAQLP